MSDTKYYFQKKLNNFLVLKELLILYKNFYSKPEKIKKIQKKKLKKLVKEAYAIPFYKERFDSVGVTIDDINEPEDLLKLPVLTKSEYRQFINETMEKNPQKYKYFFRDGTSGSSGMPLTLYQSPRERSITVAKWLREHVINHYNPVFNKTFCIISPHRLAAKDSILQNIGLFRRKSVSYLDDIGYIVEEYNKYKPDLFYANKSQFVQMCIYAEKNNIELFKPRLYACGAETMDSISKEMILRNFGKKGFYETYGCAELGILGYQKAGDQGFYYIADDTNIINVVDSNGKITDNGAALITSLYHYSFPLINYQLGDNLETYSKGGRKYISKVVGRQDDWIKFEDGDMLSFHTFYELLEKRSEIQQFRIIQETYNKIVLELVLKTDKEYQKETLEKIMLDELHELIKKENIEYEFSWKDSIPQDKNGKLRMLISKV